MSVLRYINVRSICCTDTNLTESFSFGKTCYDNKNINLIILNTNVEMVTCTERLKRNLL